MARATIADGLVYDAAAVGRIIGIPSLSDDAGPKAKAGQIAMYYGGWSLTQLRLSTAGKKSMLQQDTWYDDYSWTAEPGYYYLLLPVPGSSYKTWDEQIAHLRTIDPALQPAPVCITATALVVIFVTSNGVGKNRWWRCAELIPNIPNECGIAVTVGGDRIGVSSDFHSNTHRANLWLSAAQKC